MGASGLAQLVEIVWQLRGEAGEDRQLQRAEIGLAHSIGGLGNNNLVTLLERSDRKRAAAGSWKAGYHPVKNIVRKTDPALSSAGVGRLETFTVLYATPEGFRSPLTLGYVRTERGDLLMACNPDCQSPEQLKIGAKVSFALREGLHVFQRMTLWDRLKRLIKNPPKSKL